MARFFGKSKLLDNGIDLSTLHESNQIGGWALLFSLVVSIGLWSLIVLTLLYLVRA